MPTYEYVCKACDHEFERDQRISDPPVKTCPSCKAKQVKRLISRTSFHLKGGGWYSDLYSKPKAGGKSESDAPAPASDTKSDSSGGGAAKKSESKPEKKADKKPAKSSGSGGSGTGGSGSKAAA